MCIPFARTNWHEAVGKEWETVTSSAGVIDLSPFGKFIVTGQDSHPFLKWVTANK